MLSHKIIIVLRGVEVIRNVNYIYLIQKVNTFKLLMDMLLDSLVTFEKSSALWMVLRNDEHNPYVQLEKCLLFVSFQKRSLFSGRDISVPLATKRTENILRFMNRYFHKETQCPSYLKMFFDFQKEFKSKNSLSIIVRSILFYCHFVDQKLWDLLEEYHEIKKIREQSDKDALIKYAVKVDPSSKNRFFSVYLYHECVRKALTSPAEQFRVKNTFNSVHSKAQELIW
jgi:hypothetical protein